VAPRRTLTLLGVAAVAAVAGPFAAVAIITAMVLWPRLQQVRRERRRAAAIASAFPDFVDLLVLTITSGCSTAQSIAILADIVPEAIRPAVAHVAHGTDVGKRFADAIAGLQTEPPDGLGSIAQPLADALALADRYGTPLAPVLDRLADEARSQRRRNAEAAARQLPIRLAFPLVGCTLPSFVLLTIVPLMAGTFSSLRGLTP
jgi:tight adherence protein C